MRVVLSTISKFHTFDLARQMERLGVLERLFTGRPQWKLKHEKLPEKVSTFPYLQTIFEGLGQLGVQKYPLQKELNWQCHQTFDAYVARHLPECDIFHALSYCGLKSGLTAQKRGAKWVCDAVNSHLVFQDEILYEEYDRVGLPYKRQDRRFLDYAVDSYEQADAITVPSTFARETFLAKGIPDEKLSLVPYGVNIGHFHAVPVPQDEVFRVLFVGHLSVRKGVHYLLEAFKTASIPNSQLVLVGSLLAESEVLLGKTSAAVEIVGTQPKSQLSYYYSQADVMVFPSIEDGFGYIVGEAMACGCPVIATAHTGGRDFFTDGVEGFIVPIRSPEKIAEKLVWLYEHPEERQNMREAALQRVKSIGGWDSYGEEMLTAFENLIAFTGASAEQ